ncbi:hypothetical protein LY78DRAFT_670024 [Colletotrichum sublineola]|nr:hypothetical protein LY78DRAFT_670024 [Colletotrichum sublineola]
MRLFTIFIFVVLGVLAQLQSPFINHQDVFKTREKKFKTFWKHWMYYLNPFTYLMGRMLVFAIWGTKINCHDSEIALFDPPNGTTGPHSESLLNHGLSGGGRVW